MTFDYPLNNTYKECKSCFVDLTIPDVVSCKSVPPFYMSNFWQEEYATQR